MRKKRKGEEWEIRARMQGKMKGMDGEKRKRREVRGRDDGREGKGEGIAFWRQYSLPLISGREATPLPTFQ